LDVVLEALLVLGLAGLLAYGIHRLPDTRERLRPDVDDAPYRAGVRAVWFFVAIAAMAVLVAWLLL
jgi:hypothetical protein